MFGLETHSPPPRAPPQTLIVLLQCLQCGLVQLKHTIDGSELYEHEYGYQSGISNTMRAHLQAFNEEIRGKVPLSAGDAVLDIGSNDSTFLRFYPEGLRRIGCDPTGKQFAKYYVNGLELVPNYFTKENIASALGENAPKFKVTSR